MKTFEEKYIKAKELCEQAVEEWAKDKKNARLRKNKNKATQALRYAEKKMNNN